MTCIHRWLCGTPYHGITHATCRLCSEQRMFHDPDWTGYNNHRKRPIHGKPSAWRDVERTTHAADGRFTA